MSEQNLYGNLAGKHMPDDSWPLTLPLVGAVKPVLDVWELGGPFSEGKLVFFREPASMTARLYCF